MLVLSQKVAVYSRNYHQPLTAHSCSQLLTEKPVGNNITLFLCVKIKMRLLQCLVVLVLIYLLLFMLVETFKYDFMFYPEPLPFLSPRFSDPNLSVEDVYIDTPDSVKLHAWYMPHRRLNQTDTHKTRSSKAISSSNLAGGKVGVRARLVIFLHGAGGNMYKAVEHMDMHHRLGNSVLAVDYRGFGKSTGSPSAQGLMLDVLTTWNYATQVLRYEPQQIILHGYSLGSSLAAWLGALRTPRGIILEAPFTSLYDLIPRAVRPLFYWSMPDFQSASYIKELTCPVLIMGSEDDEIVPFSHVLEMYKSVPHSQKKLIQLTGTHLTLHHSRETQKRLHRWIHNLQSFR